ncbi:sodium- and chloride-dependent betaine transporter [Aplysia californica]|uniref:Sodium- and chloride-dependent betaine transporter n=1 Tax=Aplysia californica TaxID=6500 RepID=A0ABM0ZXV6_APLCA|nr:sodium- and chloride-dependent betaine transporter [Aplysia californica]
MEVAMGQFLSKSSWHVFAICPLFAGLGIAMNVLSLIVSWFFLVVLAWSLIYLVNSFKDPLPWTLCGQWWNSEHCRPTSGSSGGIGANGSGSVAEALNETSDQMNLWMKSYNLTASNDTVKTNLSKSASEEFWTYV